MNRRNGLIFGLALASAAVYLLFAFLRGNLGFALDDAWIHQVYARNLGTRGEFAFFPGQTSAGSTSPLWTIALSFGYVLHADFHAWAYLLGAILLGAGAILVYRITFYVLCNTQYATRNSLFAALFLVFEFHLAWSAVSGMEVPLFVFLSLLLVERFFADARTWVLGLVAGLLTLTRPEGAVLVGLIGLAIVLDFVQDVTRNTKHVVRGAWYVGVFILVLLPYLAFNLSVSGTLFPNTYYAKYAEYAPIFESVPLVVRWMQLLVAPWVGAQILLAPGAIYLAVTLAIKREWKLLIPFAWILILPALYAWRLPVAYQHGRYEMPVIPFIVLYGVWGTSVLFARIRNWVVRTTWGMSTAALVIAFWFIGANAYATDVAIIECEMVGSARWVVANVAPGTSIAAHDIGALGYYYPYPFIDLAGLVSPEVIPFIRDETRLRDFLLERNVQYAVFFPSWYASLNSDSRFTKAFQTDCVVTREAGEVNMAVYRIVR